MNECVYYPAMGQLQRPSGGVRSRKKRKKEKSHKTLKKTVKNKNKETRGQPYAFTVRCSTWIAGPFPMSELLHMMKGDTVLHWITTAHSWKKTKDFLERLSL